MVDQYWIDHIDAMEQLKQYIGLKSYAQKDPFKEYALEGYDMFEALNKNIRKQQCNTYINLTKKFM